MKHIMSFDRIDESLLHSDLVSFYDKVKSTIPEKNLYESPEMDFTDHYLGRETPRTPDTKIGTKALYCFDDNDEKLFSIGITSSSRLKKGTLIYHEGDIMKEGFMQIETNSPESLDFIMGRIKTYISKITY